MIRILDRLLHGSTGSDEGHRQAGWRARARGERPRRCPGCGAALAEGRTACVPCLRAQPRLAGTCRRCGCTDADCRGCIRRTGKPCYWVDADLCSACVAPRRGRERKGG